MRPRKVPQANRYGSGQHRRRARIRRRAVAGEVDMPERGDRKGDSFGGKAGRQRAGIVWWPIGRRNHAAAEYAASRHVLPVRIATRKLGRTVMRADDIAESVKWRGTRTRAG